MWWAILITLIVIIVLFVILPVLVYNLSTWQMKAWIDTFYKLTYTSKKKDEKTEDK